MIASNLSARAYSRFKRSFSSWGCADYVPMRNDRPYISFSFDDFPSSSLLVGGPILKRYSVRATYYASFGLVGSDGPTGRIFMPEDLHLLFRDGHELGCHTYSHSHAWSTSSKDFERSVQANRDALARLFPSARFSSLSYPISPPWPLIKRKMGKYFGCSRGGGQKYNKGRLDLRNLSAFFLEQAKGNSDLIEEIVRSNRQDNGWLIFATHDISENPTPYGCTPDFFEKAVKIAVASGAQILPVGETHDKIAR